MSVARDPHPSPMTVRISRAAHASLRVLSEEADEPMTVVLDRAIEAYRRRLFLEDLDSKFASLRADAAGWAELEVDRAAWDATIADGLD